MEEKHGKQDGHDGCSGNDNACFRGCGEDYAADFKQEVKAGENKSDSKQREDFFAAEIHAYQASQSTNPENQRGDQETPAEQIHGRNNGNRFFREEKAEAEDDFTKDGSEDTGKEAFLRKKD